MNVTLKTGTHVITARRASSGTTYYKIEYADFTAPLARWFSLAALVAAGNDESALQSWEPAITSVTIAMAPEAVKVAA